MGEIKKWSEDRMQCAEALRLIHTMCKSASELCRSIIVLETFTAIADETFSREDMKNLSYAGAVMREGTETGHDDGNYAYAILWWTLHYVVDRTHPIGKAMTGVQDRYGSVHADYCTPSSYKAMELAGDIIECVLTHSMTHKPEQPIPTCVHKRHSHDNLIAFLDAWQEFTNLLGEYLPYRYRPPPKEVVSIFFRNTIDVHFPHRGTRTVVPEAWFNGTMPGDIVEVTSEASRWLEDATRELQQSRLE